MCCEISISFTAGLCACVVWVVSVTYVGAVPVLFVLHVCMLRDCEGDGTAGVGDRGGAVVVSVWHEYVGGIRGSGIVFSAAGVIGMSVVRVMT